MLRRLIGTTNDHKIECREHGDDREILLCNCTASSTTNLAVRVRHCIDVAERRSSLSKATTTTTTTTKSLSISYALCIDRPSIHLFACVQIGVGLCAQQHLDSRLATTNNRMSITIVEKEHDSTFVIGLRAYIAKLRRELERRLIVVAAQLVWHLLRSATAIPNDEQR